MDAFSSVNTYKQQQIMTAPPEELTLMLYNGTIRFINENIMALDQGDLERAHNANMRAQDIVREFMVTLDMKYEISRNWLALYDFVEYSLVQGNIKKDAKQLIAARGVMEGLRDAWREAMESLRPAKAVNK